LRTAGSIADWGVRYIDDIVLHRQDNNADGDYTDTSSPADETFYHLTDAQFSTIAIVDDDQNIVERVTFSAYGRARHHWMADVDGDGDVDSTDTGIINTIAGGSDNLIGEDDYRAEADLDRDGDVDSADETIATNFGATSALDYGVLSDIGNPSGPGVDNQIGFDGYVFNVEAELYTVRFRWYSPVLGRWLQRDPAGYVDSRNLCEFVTSHPNRRIDPYGLQGIPTVPGSSAPPDPPSADPRGRLIPLARAVREAYRWGEIVYKTARYNELAEQMNQFIADCSSDGGIAIPIIVPERAIAERGIPKGPGVFEGPDYTVQVHCFCDPCEAAKINRSQLDRYRSSFETFEKYRYGYLDFTHLLSAKIRGERALYKLHEAHQAALDSLCDLAMEAKEEAQELCSDCEKKREERFTLPTIPVMPPGWFPGKPGIDPWWPTP